MLNRLARYWKLRKFKNTFPKVKFGSNFSVEKIDLIRNINFLGDAYVGSDANWSPKGKIYIGDNVIIGPRSIIWTYNHNINSSSFIPYGPALEDSVKDVAIGDNVWIGMNVIILPGCVIEEGVVIGAGSVVTKNVKKYSIVAGNPAKVIGSRDQCLYDKLSEKQCLYLSRNK